jgi:protein-S-isoprenylcysteine O-methyltransferase Ste14
VRGGSGRARVRRLTAAATSAARGRHLGRHQPVITTGPYRVIRHPSYAGILLAVIGLGLLIGNWLSLVSLTIAIGGGLVFRIRVEERALLRNLGDDYRNYAATHKRLIPFIW